MSEQDPLTRSTNAWMIADNDVDDRRRSSGWGPDFANAALGLAPAGLLYGAMKAEGCAGADGVGILAGVVFTLLALSWGPFKSRG